MKKSILEKAKKIHFIGIGGIGMSAIAKMFLLEGKSVSGSDTSDSEIISELKKSGAEIFIGHDEKNISKDIDLVIYTIAIAGDNSEFVEAKKRKLNTITYPEALHEISKDKYTIAISGTHGKTTTTAMIAKILMDAGLDPTVIVGSILKDAKSNFVAGKSKYLVVEACEYRKSFLNIEPNIAVVTNIDNDHLDFYKDLEDIQKAFGEFADKVPKNGYIVCDTKDKSVSYSIKDVVGKIVNNLEFKDKNLKLKIPGEHNKSNASMALAVAHILGISKKSAEKSLEDFSGTWRRFEYKGDTKKGVVVYDDYGHHPTEIKASIKCAREMFPNKKITIVFQPHLYSRTKLLLNDFVEVLKKADSVVLAPIYAAREPHDITVSSEILKEKIGKKAKSFPCFQDIENHLIDSLSKDDILITMGAGDIFKVGESILDL